MRSFWNVLIPRSRTVAGGNRSRDPHQDDIGAAQVFHRTGPGHNRTHTGGAGLHQTRRDRADQRRGKRCSKRKCPGKAGNGRIEVFGENRRDCHAADAAREGGNAQPLHRAIAAVFRKALPQEAAHQRCRAAHQKMRLRLSQSAGYLFEQFRIGDLIGRSMVKARTGHLKILGHHPRGDAFAKGIPRQTENRNP